MIILKPGTCVFYRVIYSSCHLIISTCDDNKTYVLDINDNNQNIPKMNLILSHKRQVIDFYHFRRNITKII